jgi:hypothetical protein
VKRIIDECFEASKKLLNANKDTLASIADALMMYESLTGDEVDEILHGKKPEDLRELLPDDDIVGDDIMGDDIMDDDIMDSENNL